MTALSQPDVLHQILLIGMNISLVGGSLVGGSLVGGGMVLLAVEIRTYAWERKHAGEYPTTEG